LTEPQRNIKAEIARGIVHATEAAGLADQGAFLQAIGMPADWLGRAIDEPDSVPLDDFVRVFDEASAQAGWHSTAEIIRSVVDRQRFGEWP